MKNKLKIMDHRPHISDEEINAYKDFSVVLDKYSQKLNDVNRAAYRRWVAAGTLSILFIAVSIWLTSSPGQPEPTVAKPQVLSAKPPERKETVMAPRDSSTRQPSIKVTGVHKAVMPDKQHPATPALSTQPNTQAETGYVQAEPVNGYPELYDYFSAHLVYPAEALKDSIQGVLTVSFVINREGRAENVEVLKSLGPAFDREVKRLIEGMPVWKPAALHGRPVPSKMSLPITFQFMGIKK
jgi:TonB family protein